MPRNRRDEIDDLLRQVDGRVHEPAVWSLLRRLSRVNGPTEEVRQGHLDSLLAAVRDSAASPVPVPTWRSRTAQLLAATTAKVVIASTAAAAATGGLVVTGNLPKPVETVVAAAANAVGLSIPIKDEPFDIMAVPSPTETVEEVEEPAAPAPPREPVRSLVVAVPTAEETLDTAEDLEEPVAPRKVGTTSASTAAASPSPSQDPSPTCTTQTVAPSSPDGDSTGTEEPASTDGGTTEEPATEEPTTEEPTSSPSDQAPGRARRAEPSPSPSPTETETSTESPDTATGTESGSEQCTDTRSGGTTTQGAPEDEATEDETFAPEPSPSGDGEATEPTEPTADSTEG